MMVSCMCALYLIFMYSDSSVEKHFKSKKYQKILDSAGPTAHRLTGCALGTSSAHGHILQEALRGMNLDDVSSYANGSWLHRGIELDQSPARWAVEECRMPEHLCYHHVPKQIGELSCKHCSLLFGLGVCKPSSHKFPGIKLLRKR